MNNDIIEIFPFEFTPLPIENGEVEKCPFIQNVETVLATNLQSGNSFGCKINDSHTHAGSKAHFKDFIEAELLFHNSYYNYGFAYLTVEQIENSLQNNEKDKYKKIVLIGYENYSELYLQEVQGLLKKTQTECEYCVYETIAKMDGDERVTETVIRNLYKGEKDQEFQVCYGYQYDNAKKNIFKTDDTLLVFIVPINTTLSTLDKMISLFKRILEIKDNSIMDCLLLCLITIGPENTEENYYWKIDNNNTSILIPRENRFIEIGPSSKIKTFALVESHWMYTKTSGQNTKICECCFPDKANLDKPHLDILDEKPIFDVTRGSVVPMLQLGRRDYLKPIEPINKTIQIKNNENLKKVWSISAHMSYRHIVRRENHFQYYFDAVSFLSEEDIQKQVKDDLKEIREKDQGKNNATTVIYNYIVAPRHETNARWVNLIYNYVFSSENNNEYNYKYDDTRVLYFDITKEYRSNIKAKYSDFYRMIQNIEKSELNAEIRFHYVDETITSGSNFIRAIDLIRSLISGIQTENSKTFNIALFHSIFLLYGRSSDDTKMFFMNLLNDINLDTESKLNLKANFYEFVHINISAMRTHEDACTLCKLANDYHKISKYCATNQLADVCNNVINKHQEYPIECLNHEIKENSKFQCSTEKRLVFFISHLLNERLSYDNKPIFVREKMKEQIDTESEYASKEIAVILEDYYWNAYNWLGDEGIIDTENVSIEDFHNAFIKAISRPFFTFNLRKRQAAFSFCLKELNGEISKDSFNFRLIESFVKALADMNANFIIRESKFNKLLNIAKDGDEFIKLNGISDDRKNKFFSSVNFIHSVKKTMSLTQDTTKSLLLEHLLVEGAEKNFFSNTTSEGTVCVNKFYDTENRITTTGILYLENNRIIKDALSDIENGKTSDVMEAPYFFDNFKSICKINKISFLDITSSSTKFKDFKNKYVELKRIFKDLKDNISVIDEKINKWISSLSKNLKVISFVRDKKVTEDNDDINKLFEFFMLTDSCEEREKESFYNDDCFKMLNNLLDNHDNDTVIMSNQHPGIIILRIQNDDKSNIFDDVDESIYLQISGFDISRIEHWFCIKLLLTLRGDFAKQIAKINLPEIIQSKHEHMIKEALAIRKALTHAKLESNLMIQFIKDDHEDLEKLLRHENDSYIGLYGALKAAKDNEQKIDETFKYIYCKYLTLLANELISSWYRKIIRYSKGNNSIPVFEDNKFFKNFSPDQNYDNIINTLKHLFNIEIEKEFKFYNVKSKGTHLETTEIIVKIEGLETMNNYSMKIIPIDGAPQFQNSFYLLLVLFIINANEHESCDEVYLKFDKENLCTVITNKTNISKENCDTMNAELMKKLMSFPHLRENGEGMTLWVLKHIKCTNKPWIEISYVLDGDHVNFQIKLNNIVKE